MIMIILIKMNNYKQRLLNLDKKGKINKLSSSYLHKI